MHAVGAVHPVPVHELWLGDSWMLTEVLLLAGLERSQDALRGDRQVGHAYANCRVNRVGHDRATGYDRWFADRLGAERTNGGWHLDDRHVQLRDLTRLRNGVVHQAGGDRRTGLVVRDLLVQTPADALRAAAVNLRLDQCRIDCATNVLH